MPPNNPHYDREGDMGVSAMATSKKDSRKPKSSRNSAIHLAARPPFRCNPVGSVAKWDGDKLTFWGMGQANLSHTK